jgi:membrane-associated protease RseP (regulator of RpoE activity)
MPSPDLIAAIIVAGLLAILLWHRRKNVRVQGFFPILYFVTYRTQRGINRMERMARGAPACWNLFARAASIIGFAGMAFILYELARGTLRLFTVPDAAPAIVPVLPIPVKGVLFVPFLYWIIAVPLIAVIHEFSHGIIARLYGMRLKSVGFAFLGIILPIIPAAFVEPDEKAMARHPRKEQLGVLAVGSFANILTALLVYGLFAAAINPAAGALFEPTGIQVATVQPNASAALAGILPGDVILAIGPDTTRTMQDFAAALASHAPGTAVTVRTNRTSHELILGTSPTQAGRPYLGITAREHQTVQAGVPAAGAAAFTWTAGLLYFVFLLSAGIGLFNLLPMAVLDGGKMFRLAMERLLGSAGTGIAKWVSLGVLGLILINLVNFFL